MTARPVPGLEPPVTEAMFRALFEDSEVGMIFNGMDGRIHPNPAYCRLLGFTEAELSGGTYLNVTHPDDREESQRIFDRILSGQQRHARWRKRYISKAGEVIWVDVSAGLEWDGEGRPVRFHIVVIDISHRVASEESRADENVVLESRVAERTAELVASNGDLEAFSYSVSHDLRAPLRAIAGFSRLLDKKYRSTLDETAAGYVDRIVQGADRMGQMIDDLLRFARLGRQELKCQLVDPAMLAHDSLEDLRDALEGRSVEMIIEDMPQMWADRPLLQHVYLNLLSNAIKFTAGRQDARVVVRSHVDPDRGCVYSVEDNGVGFDMQYADRIFGVFQRLHERDLFEGTGVGLALVQAIVERHGGQVWVDAAVDRGATFSFTLAAQP